MTMSLLVPTNSIKKRSQPTDLNESIHRNEPQGKKSKKRLQQEARELAEEERLEALLFGGGGKTTSLLSSDAATAPKQTRVTEEPAALFEIDRAGNEILDVTVDDNVVNQGQTNNETTDGRAWVDVDDDLVVDLMQTSRLRKLRTSREEAAASALPVVEFESRLRKRYEETAQLAAHTDWARIDVDKTDAAFTDDKDETLALSTSAPFLLHASAKSSSLPANVIGMVRCSDANETDPCRSVVQSVHFHPTSNPEQPLMLTAGLDKMLRFFQVGADHSEKVHGIQFPKLPIYSASFLGSSGNVIVSGRRSFFYIYDAVAGKVDLVPRILGRQEKSLEKFSVSPDGSVIAFYGNDGYIILVDARTKEWIADLKMNGSVRAVTFSANGDYLYGSGSDGQVYQWETASRRCIDRFNNEDGTITSSMACSSQHLAVGAESGVVNVYQSQKQQEEPQQELQSSRRSILSNRQPVKSIMNLHTSSDLVRFNGDGQILAISSRRERQALKLVHVPSRTVFSNWPTTKTPLNYVWSLDFSPQSRFMAVGNDKGKCLLYRLSHYNKD
ncbi:hypothetical protein MPSEU_000396000 [Mayamaea pseudoterrestris]|nr:hypothetical protein MPSEU_000396000 [Mayamaea pseudoterrestris]